MNTSFELINGAAGLVKKSIDDYDDHVFPMPILVIVEIMKDPIFSDEGPHL